MNQPTLAQPSGLVDILDKILDKGVVVAGDVKVKLLDIELLTLQLRLVICSIDKAEQIGLDFWNNEWRGGLLSSDRPKVPSAGDATKQPA